MWKRLRGGRGIGDTIYQVPIVKHYLDQGNHIEACTDYPEIFRGIQCDQLRFAPFAKNDIKILAHYALRKRITQAERSFHPGPGTDQFEDMCISAGTPVVKQSLFWSPANRELIDRVKDGGRPVLCLQMPREPMGRADGFGTELLPRYEVMDHILNLLSPRFKVVQIGKGDVLHHFGHIDLDLSNQTSVTDLIDIASACDAFLGYCSYIVPLAEAFQKPLLCVWSRRGLNSNQPYIKQITPQKILHQETSFYVVDDWEQSMIEREVALWI